MVDGVVGDINAVPRMIMRPLKLKKDDLKEVLSLGDKADGVVGDANVVPLMIL